jgi:5-dehydro-2-deoxygluconokinase
MKTAEAWFAGEIGDEEAVAAMAARFGRLAAAWEAAAGGRAA